MKGRWVIESPVVLGPAKDIVPEMKDEKCYLTVSSGGRTKWGLIEEALRFKTKARAEGAAFLAVSLNPKLLGKVTVVRLRGRVAGHLKKGRIEVRDDRKMALTVWPFNRTHNYKRRKRRKEPV